MPQLADFTREQGGPLDARRRTGRLRKQACVQFEVKRSPGRQGLHLPLNPQCESALFAQSRQTGGLEVGAPVLVEVAMRGGELQEIFHRARCLIRVAPAMPACLIGVRAVFLSTQGKAVLQRDTRGRGTQIERFERRSDRCHDPVQVAWQAAHPIPPDDALKHPIKPLGTPCRRCLGHRLHARFNVAIVTAYDAVAPFIDAHPSGSGDTESQRFAHRRHLIRALHSKLCGRRTWIIDFDAQKLVGKRRLDPRAQAVLPGRNGKRYPLRR